MVGILSTLIKTAAVFGLLAVTIRMLRRLDRPGHASRRRPGGRRASRRCRDERLVEVVERTSVGRASALVLVRVQGRYCMVGVTEQHVSMLFDVEMAPEPDSADRADGADGADGGATVLDLRARRMAPWSACARQVLERLPARTHVEAVPTPQLSDLAIGRTDAQDAR